MARADRRAKERAAAKRRQHIEAKEKSSTRFLPPRVSRLITLTLVAVVVLGLAVWGVSSLVAARAATAKVVKIVDGQNITQHDLDTRVKIVRFANNMPPFKPETVTAVLDSLVDERVMLTEAATRGLVSTDQDIADYQKRQETSLTTLYGSALRITVARLRRGLSPAEMTAYVKAKVLNEQLFAIVTADVKLTDEEIVAFYEQYKGTLVKEGLSLQDVRDTLGAEILQQKRGETYSGFLRELREKAAVVDPK